MYPKNARLWLSLTYNVHVFGTWPVSAVGNTDCRSRGHKFDPGPVPYFCGDWSWWYNFYSHSPPDSRRVVVSHKRKYVHEVLVNHFLVKLALEKVIKRELRSCDLPVNSCPLNMIQISREPFERFSLNFTQNVPLSELVCRAHDAATWAEGQGHRSRSKD